ncbi:MAG: 3-deoxy-manno-octulosonate cytidylyltransferase [Bacteriovoracaceae bacterium]|jgi:3-deoxy-manno-octulosonate cytidylyltransferase (CMP-KDO synthetase)|nr:3-deoxy-manno-octulosonate cytidylyltransferase [Bacteriovoracaceae bacterium]
MSKTLILIPARYQSSRFPGKPLAKIGDNPMIKYVCDNCERTGFDYAVVTDDDKIEAYLKSVNANVVRVDDDVTTGSERIALAYQRFFQDKNYSYIINVQGDEPLLKGELISEIGQFHEKNNHDIITAVKRRSSDEEDFQNPNVVKCLFVESSGNCQYFSRSSIPYSREDISHDWFQHVGVYSYKVESLLAFNKARISKYEDLEKLEQLRALEMGMTIGAVETDLELIGVDRPEDIDKIKDRL